MWLKFLLISLCLMLTGPVFANEAPADEGKTEKDLEDRQLLH